VGRYFLESTHIIMSRIVLEMLKFKGVSHLKEKLNTVIDLEER
jgi:hypothetical protein